MGAFWHMTACGNLNLAFVQFCSSLLLHLDIIIIFEPLLHIAVHFQPAFVQ